MKIFVLTASLSLILVTGFAQGTFNFANAAFGVDAPVTDGNGQPLAGPSWEADLYWAEGTVSDSSLLIALGQPANFSVTAPGYFFGGTRSVPAPPGVITAQVRVWNAAYGPSWASAVSVGSPTGESSLFQVTLPAVPYPPANLTGLKPFTAQLILVPEPNALGLGVIGIGAHLVLRKRPPLKDL